MGVGPQSVRFQYGRWRKPSIADAPSYEFNLTHTDGIAAVALCRGTQVGIDVETIRSLPELEAMSRTVFNNNELAALRRHDGAIETRDFFLGWTRKEACLKAVGSGVSSNLHGLTVSLKEAAPRVVAFEGVADAHRWSLWNLFPAPGCVGAVVAAQSGLLLEIHSGLPF
jgi:4'-phosphopantetheinyl transferase